ncbi:MAG: hypothetical protein AAF492_07720 [Verrucomicrobiota bacterium]
MLVPESRGHFREFVAAAKGELAYDAPLSHFGFSGPMCEVLGMGNAAALAREKLAVDAKTGMIRNLPFTWRKPRAGWGL